MKYIFALLLLVTAIISCQNSKEELVTDTYNDYYPLQIGKSVTYRLDSLIFTKSGSVIETHKYRVKHTIQSEITDNQGRKAFLVNKLLNNEAGTGPWLEQGNYIVTPLANQLEVTENNQRVIKLHNPIRQGFSWRGNTYLPTSPYRPAYEMDAGSDMNQWKFFYRSFGDTAINGQQYQNVWSVEQSNTIMNLPPVPEIKAYGLMEVSNEKYAKGIGMVYRKHYMYEYQPGHEGNAYQPSYIGFGVTMWMVAHD